MPGPLRIALAVALSALSVGLAACGDDEPTTTTTTSPPTTTGATGATGENGAGGQGDAGIDPASGETFGLEPDTRVGTLPPAPPTGDLAQVADAAGCELRLDLADEGNTHVPRSRDVEYETSPPTSGDHDQVPLADGAYLETPEERFFVHSLEHGRVVIAYQPDLPEDDQLALKGLFDEDPDGMVLIPYRDMPYEVAASAWTNLIGCESYSPGVLDALAAFRDEFRGKGPEPVPL